MQRNGDMDWSNDRMARLRALHRNDKLSFDMIAEVLSEEFKVALTKNACIGKARRMGLPERTTKRKRKVFRGDKRRRQITLVASTSAPIEAEVVPCVLPRWRVMQDEAPAERGKLTLLQLNDNTCRWPHGDRVPYLFCGAPTAGKTYCAYHTGISCGRTVGMTRDRVNT
jgi:GcrA cell cycle regulator